jgi:hypothetical protein
VAAAAPQQRHKGTRAPNLTFGDLSLGAGAPASQEHRSRHSRLLARSGARSLRDLPGWTWAAEGHRLRPDELGRSLG